MPSPGTYTGAFQIFLDKVLSIKISLGLKIEGRKIEGRRRTEQQRMRQLDAITSAMDVNLGKLWEMMRYRESWNAEVPGVVKNQT